MANTQTTVPLFVANQVLTAAQQNASAGTGVPVFATTVTRDAAFGGSNKALAEGQLAYIEASNIVQYYDGAAWATVGPSSAGGLVFISANTVTASSSISINNCFTSTYQNYRILFAPSASTGTDPVMTIRLRASATDSTTTYRNQRVGGYATTAYASANPSGTDDWFIGPYDASAATSASFAIEMFSPNEARATSMSVITYGVESGVTQDITIIGGSHTTASAYDGFTLISGGTNITGIIYVYGYAKA